MNRGTARSLYLCEGRITNLALSHVPERDQLADDRVNTVSAQVTALAQIAQANLPVIGFSEKVGQHAARKPRSSICSPIILTSIDSIRRDHGVVLNGRLTSLARHITDPAPCSPPREPPNETDQARVAER